MAKLNSTAKGKAVSRYTKGTTTNKEGAPAFKLNDHSKLLTSVLTCFFKEPKYYGDTSNDIISTARKVIATDPEFVAKLACYARNEFHMRTISQVLAAEVAKHAKGNPIVRKMTRRVIERPDDMTNMLAYYFHAFGARNKGNSITRGMRRGIADVFPKFDEYQLAKYKGIGNDVKLRDALLIARPKPESDEQAALWKRLITDTLATPQTRETILSSQGQSTETWENLIKSKKMGYMATLRNLKNILDNKVSNDLILQVCNYLKNEKAVTKSKQLPFRFLSAYLMVRDNCSRHPLCATVLDALEDAMDISVQNIPKFDGITFMTADESASMGSPISKNSMIRQIDVGNLLMSIGSKFCDQCITSVFGDRFKTVAIPKRSGILSNMNHIIKVGREVGMATELYKAIEWLNKTKTKVDRIVVFSDMQAYTNSFGWGGNAKAAVHAEISKYKKNVNPNVWVHSIDLAGYGTAQVMGDRVNLMAGWSDKVLHFIKMMENSEGDLLDSVRNYQI